MLENNIKGVQTRILEIISYIDKLARENDIEYFIMGGTALGAVRHGGFIPWDDDLDIFMTPTEYEKFKKVFYENNDGKFFLEEWKTVPEYLEYAKVRMNGTTFIEKNFISDRKIHQGIFVDIMILHKVPENVKAQKRVYYSSKFVTLYGITQRNWKPKNFKQKLIVFLMKFLPKKLIAKKCYKRIYKYDGLTDNYKYCYFITTVKFKKGIFDRDFFDTHKEIEFDGLKLLCPNKIEEYLKERYGDYMKLPSEAEQKAAVHAEIYDMNCDYRDYFNKIDGKND